MIKKKVNYHTQEKPMLVVNHNLLNDAGMTPYAAKDLIQYSIGTSPLHPQPIEPISSSSARLLPSTDKIPANLRLVSVLLRSKRTFCERAATA